MFRLITEREDIPGIFQFNKFKPAVMSATEDSLLSITPKPLLFESKGKTSTRTGADAQFKFSAKRRRLKMARR